MRGERNKTKVMHNALTYQLTDAQQVCMQCLPLALNDSPPFLLFSMTMYSKEYPFGLAVLALSLPSSLCTPSLTLVRQHNKLKSP